MSYLNHVQIKITLFVKGISVSGISPRGHSQTCYPVTYTDLFTPLFLSL